MLPKLKKDKLFTIIYADILIFANFCQLMPIFADILLIDSARVELTKPIKFAQ